MRNNRMIYLLLLLSILLAVLFACSAPLEKTGVNHHSSHINLQKKKQKQSITLAAIGDLLIHDRVYEDMKQGNGYNFKPALQYVKPYLNKADITFANQETMIGGTEIGLSTYPSFNSPYEVGDALKDVGVDIVSIANNHTLDRGEKAVHKAIKHWKEINMTYVGAYENSKDQQKLRILQTDQGISVAFLAYTYGTNGILVPKGKDYLVNLIDKKNIVKTVKKAKQKADAVVLSLHFGIEYERMPNKEQRDLVKFVADQGADIVLGHHPHVLQPISWVKGKHGHQTLAIYSLGNFLSGQDGFYKQTGGIFSCRINKKEQNGKSQVKVSNPAFMPTYVKYGEWQPIPMKNLHDKDLQNAKSRYSEINKHMSQWVPDLGAMDKTIFK